MLKFKEKPTTFKAVQWFKNGLVTCGNAILGGSKLKI
jgi:hypothetical protein